MLRRVPSLPTSPRDDEEAGQAIEEVEGAEGVKRHAQPGILHNDDRSTSGEVGARRHPERGVLARLAEVQPAALELGEHGLHERAEDTDEEVEAAVDEAVDEADRRRVGQGGRYRTISAHARR